MMRRQLVSPDKPVSILTGVCPEYTKQGIAVDCGHVILVRRGSATLKINFRQVRQEKDVVVILFPGDVVMVEDVSADFELEYLVYTEDIQNQAFLNLKSFSIDMLRVYCSNSSQQIATLTDCLFRLVYASLFLGTVQDVRTMAIYQLSAFFTAYHSYLASKGIDTHFYHSRSKELFTQFIHLLNEHCRESRNVAYYAEQMNITTRYLSKVVLECTNASVKNAIDDYVMMQIMRTIQNSEKSINEIAWEFNFSSLSFFCDYFKRHAGMTPNDYRKKYS
jgi:AraC-like DNA-binding protein